MKQRIRDLGERLDSHRKKQQELHPDLTLTGLYNVLEKLRSGSPLSDKDRAIHDKGLVSILKQIHDDLDAAVLEAYGWQDLPGLWHADIPGENSGIHIDAGLGQKLPLADHLARGGESAEALEQELLTRLVALNHERAEEEKRGLIRWLRPEYQAPEAPALPVAEQQEIKLAAGASAIKAAMIPDKLKWPPGLAEQFATIQKLAPALNSDPEAIAARFGRKSAKRTAQVAEILDTLQGLGKL